jgi:hypothetical protein
MSEEQRELRRTLEKLNGKLLLAKHCIRNIAELKAFIKRTDVSCIELMLARMVERAISKAEIQYLNWIYERLGWDFDEENYRRRSAVENEMIREVSDLGFTESSD